MASFYKSFGADVPDGHVGVAGREYPFRAPGRWTVGQRLAIQAALEKVKSENLAANDGEGIAEHDARVRPIFVALVVAILGESEELRAALESPEAIPIADVTAMWGYMCNPAADTDPQNPLASLRALLRPSATKPTGSESQEGSRLDVG